MMNTRTEAVELLTYAPICTDAVVERLETLAKPQTDATLLSDLAGAYYVRAQRNDRPSDFVRSLDVADRAVALTPTMPAAQFNRALSLEALGFDNDAIAAWTASRKDLGPDWAKEAEQHHQRLLAKRSRTTAADWSLNKERLPIVARAKDREAVRRLVSPYRNSAQEYVELEVLPRWAEASIKGRAGEAAEQLALAEMIASALTELTHDRYLLDSVERIHLNRDPHALKQLEDGHRLFASAPTTVNGRGPSRATVYAKAEHALAEAGSPLQFGAMLGRATELTQSGDYGDAAALLASVEQIARKRRYFHLLGRVYTGRGYLLNTQGRDLDAFAEYSGAQAIFEQIHDVEKVGGAQDRMRGLLREIGDKEFAWRAAFQAETPGAELVDVQARHIHWGENALAAAELGHPSIALRYQNIAVRLIEDELSRGSDKNIGKLRLNLGIALRTRAGIYVALGDLSAAKADLNASSRLMDATGATKSDEYIPLGFQARLLETEAKRLARTDRRRAIEAISKGIELAKGTYYRSLIASLRLQRAELHRADGDLIAATRDLQSAVMSLRDEERSALERQNDGKRSDIRLWSSYFSRSQDAYRQLIRIHVESRDDVTAFEYAEKARGYEPLYRILHRSDLPTAFRERIHGDEPLRLADVQQFLPADTFLLEYSVHDDDRTEVWIIGSTSWERRTLQVGEKTIREWTRSLQRFASLRNEDQRFDAALAAPYKALLEEPLGIVEKLQGQGRQAKIVVVPDRSMHGLPFAALRNGSHYLIQDHAVSVAGSATLYAFSVVQNQQLSHQTDQSVLLFADPKVDDNLRFTYGLKALTPARSEVGRIRGVYASVARVDPPLMDDRATVPAFLRLAQQSTIIHLAVHGVANPEVPSRSFLLLASTQDDRGGIDAERLSAELHLTKTRLAVLSACSSAGGTPVGPEGLSPLVRPLIVAGVPGVIGTLWNVRDDVATEDLLVRFHRYYRDGRDADDALRQAQLDMLSRSRVGYLGARSWSAFQMIGYASSPFPASADETRRKQ